MRIRLSYKLFGAFFLILLIVGGAMLLSKLIFTVTLKSYIREMEKQRMVLLLPELQKSYRENNGWEKLRGDSDEWRRLLIKSGPDLPPPPPPRKPSDSDGKISKKGDHHGPPGGPPMLYLVDADKQPVAGRSFPTDAQMIMPVEVDAKVVGWLGLPKFEPFEHGPPRDLMQRQTMQFYLLSGVVIALTALIALLLSRHLLRPIQELIQGTQEIADLDFTVRIEPATKDELGQLAENFNVMAQTLESYEARQQQWLSDISHELRTPLSVLRAEIEALQDGVRTAGPESLTSLHAETLLISKLVEDLHMLSMAETDNPFLDKKVMRS